MPRGARRWVTVAGIAACAAALLWWQRRRGSELDRRLAAWHARGYPLTLEQLEAWYPQVPDSNNAATLSQTAAGFIQSLGDEGYLDRWTSVSNIHELPPESRRFAVDYLATNTPALARIHEALERPYALYPLNLKAGGGMWLPPMIPIKQLSRQLRAAAAMAAVAGQNGVATQCIEDGLLQAHTLSGEPLLISHLVEIALLAITAAGAQTVLAADILTDKDLTRLAADFHAAAAVDCKSAFVGEVCFARSALDATASQLARSVAPTGIGPSFLELLAMRVYKTAGLVRQDELAILDTAEPLILASGLPPHERRLAFHEQETAVARRVQNRLLWLSKGTLVTYPTVGLKSLRVVTTLECAATACAIERWRLGHSGALPQTLQDLVPAYLAEIPTDSVDGKPLRFRPRGGGYVVYGLGNDGKDHGGLTSRESPNGIAGSDNTFLVDR